MSTSDATDPTRRSRSALRSLQDARLREAIEHAYDNVDFYRERLDAAGLRPADITGVDDLVSLPFTTKEDFRDQYPTGLFAVDLDDVVRLHASSGTTGKPKVVGYTREDLAVWREVMCRGFRAAGLDASDSIQNAYSYGLFTGGFGFHDAATAMGLGVVPAGGGNTQRQVELLCDLGATAICLTPSYALYLAETAAEMGHDLRDLPVSTVLYGAEPCTEPMRREIEARFDAVAVENYGLSELIGPGVAVECLERGGMHVWEDHFFPEVIDPRTGDPVDEGEPGELVLTSLTKEALPVLRYRTGDMTTLEYETCDCGRTAVRMDGVTGRADDLLVVRGVNVYPSEVESVVLEFDAVAPFYRIDLRRDGPLDRFELMVELTERFESDREALRGRIHERLSNVLGFHPDDLSLVNPGTLDRQATGKIQRVYDHRP